MKQRALRFSRLADLQSIRGLDRITETDGSLSIGALATHQSVERSPALAQAFSHVGNVRIRETASVGGNLAHADYRLNPSPMLAIDRVRHEGKQVVAVAAEGRRRGKGRLPGHVVRGPETDRWRVNPAIDILGDVF